MTELSGKVMEEALPKHQQRRARGSRIIFVFLLLLCVTAMAGWLGFLGWGSGHLMGIW
jgi:hypothetical protein